MLTLGAAAETDSVWVGTRGRALPVGLGCRQDPGSDSGSFTILGRKPENARPPEQRAPPGAALGTAPTPPASSGPSSLAWLEVSERAEETGTRFPNRHFLYSLQI